MELYEAFALHCASNEDRQRSENFIAIDLHDEPMQLDYDIWVLRNQARTIVVDTGFTQREAKTRKRTLARSPKLALEALNIDSDLVET